MSATTMAQGTRWPDKRARPGPVCDVCCIRPATLFCRNDDAFLCDACNARVHLSNPFAACHDLVSISDKSQLGTGVVKVDPSPTDATQQSSLLSGAELSHSSSTSDHALLRGTAGEALFDPIADSSLLELFSVGNFDTGLDDFQQGELDHDWIEAFEKESSQPTMTSLPAPASEPAGQGSHSARPGTEPLGEPFTSQPGAFQLQTWNCDYDPTAQNPLPTNRSPSTFAPSVLQFLMTPFCPPTGTRSHLMPQCLQLQHTQHDSMDRKARVARYREKRKHRTFENKIRYASRKLYAESRPRIKGRFARPDELEAYLKEKEEAETQEKRKWTNMDNKLKHDK